jgi:dihydroflavonol-4-reductase
MLRYTGTTVKEKQAGSALSSQGTMPHALTPEVPIVQWAPVIAAITGASGHVGASLSRALLAAGEAVRLLVHRDTRALTELNAEQVQADLNDIESLRRAFDGVEVVYHLAVSISLDRRHSEGLRQVNIVGTGNVIQACRDCSVRRLIHFSTIEALADLNPQKATDESNPLAGQQETTLYGWTKAEAERLVLTAAANGLDAIILSPTAILGPDDYKPSHLGQSLLDIYHNRLPALIRGGFNWVDVRDVADGAMAACRKGKAGQRYILGGTWRSIYEMATLVRDITGGKTPKLVLPLWLGKAAAMIVGRLPGLNSRYPAFTPDALIAICKHRQVDCRKAEQELGYSPRPLEQSLEDTFRWFGERGLLEGAPTTGRET